ncbi:Translin family [Popillia japonica]|uniref:Translin family n=1 Tax=Popillia japonica TaxID=7064 RepID=A0AAW1K285_POPJA
MSSHKVHRRNSKRNNTKHTVGEKARQVLENINANSPIIQLFQTYATELDDKHDRYERVIKISRDITIESKRIIFLLHHAGTEIEEKKEHIFAEANLRLTQLLQKFKMIAYELKNLDHYLYLRAYSNGLQEYIEAVYFYEYQRNAALPTNDETITDLQLCCPIVEILLGLGDFTGEMMRKCINNLGSGNIDDCFKTCNFVRNIFMGFLGLNLSGQSLISRKFYTLKQSLAKMEVVCYNIKVRGSEVPKHMLASVVTSTPDENSDEDEGYY